MASWFRFNGVQTLPQACHLVQGGDQRVIVVGQGDPRLEDFVVPDGVLLLEQADQVPGLDVRGGLLGA
ncbi:hypothetical protein D3C80_2048690 [compost metagenome]